MKKTEWLLMIVFLIAGIGMIVGGVYIQNENNKFMKNAKKTTATITRIDVSYDSDGDSDHDVYVEYAVKGERYTGRLNEYNSGMYEGKDITIYYNPENPRDFRGTSSSISSYIIMGIGAVFTIISSVFIVKKVRTGGKSKKLKKAGLLLEADITNITLNESYSVNRKHPYIIECSGVINGLVHNFKSENIWFDAPMIYNNLGVKKIFVYVNPEKVTEYYVDVKNYERFLGK